MATDPTHAADSPTRRSLLATLLFLAAALLLPCGLFGFHFVAWFLQQIALASASVSYLDWAGKLSMPAQGIALSITLSLLIAVARDERYRAVYRTWRAAALFAFAATALRFLSPNQDQIGALAQTALAAIGLAVIFAVRRGQAALRASFDLSALAAAFAASAAAALPFALYGALGSPSDAALSLISGLAFGLLAVSLIPSSTGNFILDGLSIGGLLAILGSEFGYDGGQLLLAAALPSAAFAAAALAESAAAVGIFIGLAVAASLAFFDPTEFTILLGGGEIGSWAARAVFAAIGINLGGGLLLRLARGLSARIKIPLALSAAGAASAWVFVAGVYLTAGQPGFHGDRLFVILKDQADVSSAAAIRDRDERISFVYRTLTQHADSTQADLRRALNGFGVRYTPYYLVNAMEVDGGALTRFYLSTRPEVDRVLDSPRLRPLPEPNPVRAGETTAVGDNPVWNVKMIGADRAWREFGATGKGIVVGQSDSGVDGSHPALHDAYRGRDSGDDYNWYDPWDGTPSPNDEGGHGTHTLGTILGSGGIGVAPGAQWMACVNLNRNLGNPALYLDCLQFMLAPFPRGGDPFMDGDPTKAAHVLNNSWGCPPIEGCDANALRPAVRALRAAGIFVVASAGNDGPNCGTVADPIALYDSVFSVAAVDRRGSVAEFSSRGPVAIDGSNRIKPDIAAPGVDIFSSLPNGTYGVNSGTSMAGPHVAGAVALLWSAQPALIGDIERTTQILIETARPYDGDVSPGCFDDAGRDAVGYGIVEAYAAVKVALGK